MSRSFLHLSLSTTILTHFHSIQPLSNSAKEQDIVPLIKLIAMSDSPLSWHAHTFSHPNLPLHTHTHPAP